MRSRRRAPRLLRGQARAVVAALVAVILGASSAVAQAPAPAEAEAPQREVPGPIAAPPAISAQGAILWVADEDLVLYEREAEIGRPPASTTKIMTVLLAQEAFAAGRVSGQVTISAHAVEVGATPGAANLGLDVGQVVPLEDLLAGLVVRSGNDAAVAVAEHVAGSEAAFVDLMNARAAELGLADTHFINATGLTDDLDHRASPFGLARLAAVAMADPAFASWAGADMLVVPTLGPLENRNELLGTYPGATGVKTGFTNLAGMCLVASATRGDRTYYAVVLGSEDSFGDTAALFDYAFDRFERPVALTAGAPAARYRWSDATVELVAADMLAHTVGAGAQVYWRADLDPDVAPPVEAGATLGTAELIVDDAQVAEVPLVAATAVTAPPAQGATTTVGAALADAVRTFARIEDFPRALG